MAESFFATLKTELVDRHGWPTRATARCAIFEYIEVIYNRQRLDSSPSGIAARSNTSQPR